MRCSKRALYSLLGLVGILGLLGGPHPAWSTGTLTSAAGGVAGGAGLTNVTTFPLAPNVGDTVIVTDDSVVGACDSAGGVATTICRWNGSNWIKLGDGTSAGGALSSGDIDTSAEIKAIVTDETGSGALVFANTPTLDSPILGTPTSVTLTNATGLPVAGISNLGANVGTALITPSSLNLKAAITDETGSGQLVFANTPSLISPILGTPTSGTLTNTTGYLSANLADLGANVATFLATPSSTNLASAVTGETGSGALVFATSPTFVTPLLGTPTSGVLTNATGYPVASLANIAAGVATALTTPSSANIAAMATDETGSGALVFANTPTFVTPILGTPQSGNLSNTTGYPTASLTGLGTGVATFLATPSSANLAAAVTGETGSGAAVFATSPALVTPDLGTPTSLTLTNATGLPVAGLSNLGSNVGTFLITPSSANFAAAVTGETGTGAVVFGTAPTISSAVLSTVVNWPSVTAFPGTPNVGDVVIVTDDAATGDCASAGGTATSICRWNGTDWLKLGDGTSTGSTLTTSDIDTSAEIKAIVTDETGSGALVFATSPSLVTPDLGTPSAGVLTNTTAFPTAQLAGAGTGVLTFLATPTSANLAAAITNETGSGAAVFATSPTFVTPVLGTVQAGSVLTNATGFPVANLAGAAAGVLTALATPSSANLATAITDETGTGLAVFGTNPVLTTPNLGVPTALTLTNATGLPVAGLSNLGANVGTFLITPSSANLAAAVTGETGTGSLVFGTAPTITLANGTGLPLTTGVTGTLPVANGGTGLTTFSADQVLVGTATAVFTAKSIADCDDSAGNHLNYDTTAHAFSCGTSSSGSGIGGTLGSTDNAVPRANGTGGSTLQASGCTIDDSDMMTCAGGFTAGTSGVGILTLLEGVSPGAGTNAGETNLYIDSTTHLLAGFLNGAGSADDYVTKASTQTLTNKTLTSPTLVTPALGTPASGNLTNATNYPVASLANLGTGIATFLATPTSANLISAVTNETGSGALVFGTAPTITSATLVTPALGTPASGNLSSTTGYATANLTGAGTGVLTFLATPSSANLASAITDETGSGAAVFGTSPTFTTSIVLPNGTAPTTSVVGNIAIDTDIWGTNRGTIQIYDGTANTYAVNTLASDTPGDGECPKWHTGGTITWDSCAGGSGTVTATGGALTANSVVLGAGTTDTKVVAGITTDGTSILNLGVNTTTIGKVKMFGNTSGDVTLTPNAVAGTATVLTLPATTGTVAITSGNVATATALAADPADCSANQFANAINASGTLSCSALTLAGAQFANQGTTTQVLHGNGSGNPSWGAVAIGADVSGLGTGVATALAANANATGGVVTVDGTATLTNKTLTAPVISSISNTGTLTLPTTTDTLIGKATTDVLTNKTLDAEGTGNVITIPRRIWLPAAGCNNATAGPVWDLPATNPAVAACVTGTNTQKGVLNFTDGTALSAQNHIKLPSTWTGTVDANIKWYTSVTSGDVVWQLSTICVADAETDDPAFNTASTVTDTAKGTTLQTNDATITTVTVTGCAAGELMHLKILRDSAHASDTLSSATAVLIGVELVIREAI